MSVYQQFLSAAIDSGSSSAVLRDCRAQYILEEEQPLHQFVTTHLGRYGQLPSREALSRAGFRLPSVSEGTSYYFDLLKQRYMFNVINTRQGDLRRAMVDRDVTDALAIMRETVDLCTSAQQTDGVTSLVSEVGMVTEEMQRRKFISGMIGAPTGWPSLDEKTLGFMGGDVIVIAGRPSQGKSWTLLESASAAWAAGKSILIVTMEMSKAQVTQRWMGRHLGINPNYIRSGKVSKWVEDRILAYQAELAGMPRVSIIAGDMKKQIEGIESAIAEHLPDVVYIDAAYLLTPSGVTNRGISRWESIGLVINQLKQLAIRYDRPVVLTVQFNRNVKGNSTKELDLADIGGSDSIPQDASVVIGVRMGLPPFERMRRRMHILKNREGDVGEFHTAFTFDPPRFNEIDPEVADATDVEWMV